jgi:hypothetical protein
MHKPEIWIQYFNGCPNSSEMIKRVTSAISGLEDQVDYEEILVGTSEIAESIKFRGSPTLLINGEDFEGLPEPGTSFLSCRFYLAGLPSIENIRKRILDLLNY